MFGRSGRPHRAAPTKFAESLTPGPSPAYGRGEDWLAHSIRFPCAHKKWERGSGGEGYL